MSDDDAAWNNSLCEVPFYCKTQASPTFNQLFTALWVLILCSITRISTFFPDASQNTQFYLDWVDTIDKLMTTTWQPEHGEHIPPETDGPAGDLVCQIDGLSRRTR